MICPNCIASFAGFLNAYWVTIAVSICIFISAVFAFIWALNSGQFKDIESVKYRIMKED